LKKILFAFFLFIGTTSIAQMTFVHPGALSDKAELEFIKTKIQSGSQPWTNAFQKMRELAIPFADSTAPASEEGQKADGQQAYANALAWYFTGDVWYANQAIGILNMWGKTFRGYTPVDGQNQLVAGWIGTLLGSAAEIMTIYPGWARADKERLQAMFRHAFYPALNKMSTWNGNVDLAQIDAMMSIAIFNEDETEFRLAVSRFNERVPAYFYQVSDGVVPPIPGDGGDVDAFWSYPAKWLDGLTQESCRDNNHHAQYGMASALHAAEIAWHQGVDLYTPYTKRFTDAMELMARQVTSGNMQGTCNNNYTTTDIFDTWEVGYSHYHFRKGMRLPDTRKVLKKAVRKNGVSDWNIFFETLTHADLQWTSQNQ
jgi:hypothetical protein